MTRNTIGEWTRRLSRGLGLAGIAQAQTATTTVLTSATNPVPVGGSSVLTATVSPPEATGSVTFKDGTSTIGTATLSGGVATLSRTFTTASSRSLSAIYAGNTSYTTSTSATLSQNCWWSWPSWRPCSTRRA